MMYNLIFVFIKNKVLVSSEQISCTLYTLQTGNGGYRQLAVN